MARVIFFPFGNNLTVLRKLRYIWCLFACSNSFLNLCYVHPNNKWQFLSTIFSYFSWVRICPNFYFLWSHVLETLYSLRELSYKSCVYVLSVPNLHFNVESILKIAQFLCGRYLLKAHVISLKVFFATINRCIEKLMCTIIIWLKMDSIFDPYQCQNNAY